jgi:hypothetical protein
MQPFAILFGAVDVTGILPSEQTLDSVTESSVFLPIYFGLLLLTAVGVWATFVKAGEHGWTCIVPIYNLVVQLKIARIHPLWLVAALLPLVNFVFACFVAIRLARLFGKGIGFGLGLVFFPFIFYPVLGFGSAKYQAEGAKTKDGKAPAEGQLRYRKAG